MGWERNGNGNGNGNGIVNGNGDGNGNGEVLFQIFRICCGLPPSGRPATTKIKKNAKVSRV